MDRCLFLSFAHPDDETFTTGGTCARYSDEGVRIVLSTATLGEAGKPGDPPVCLPEELPRVREGELREALPEDGLPHAQVAPRRELDEAFHEREQGFVRLPRALPQLQLWRRSFLLRLHVLRGDTESGRRAPLVNFFRQSGQR